MFNDLNHMIRIEQIEADNNSPAFLRNHCKQENVWNKQYQESSDMASVLLDYPSECVTIEKWKEGMLLVHEMAMLVGIIPTLYKNDASVDYSCFFSPDYAKQSHY